MSCIRRPSRQITQAFAAAFTQRAVIRPQLPGQGHDAALDFRHFWHFGHHRRVDQPGRGRSTAKGNGATAEDAARLDDQVLPSRLETQLCAGIDHQAGAGLEVKLLPGLEDQCPRHVGPAIALHIQVIVGLEHDVAIAGDVAMLLAVQMNRADAMDGFPPLSATSNRLSWPTCCSRSRCARR